MNPFSDVSNFDLPESVSALSDTVNCYFVDSDRNTELGYDEVKEITEIIEYLREEINNRLMT